jgi:prevent-host-death family protein
MKRNPTPRDSEAVVPAAEFKAKCLAFFDAVERKGRSFIVTKRGRPVARIVPLAPRAAPLNGSLLHEEDLLSPIEADWQARR